MNRALAHSIAQFRLASSSCLLGHFVEIFLLHSWGIFQSKLRQKGMRQRTWQKTIISFQLEFELNQSRNYFILFFSIKKQRRHRAKPRVRPYRTWLRLCAPKYMRDVETDRARNRDSQKFNNFGPSFLHSIRIPNPITAENQLWPLGFPYSTGQQNPIFLTTSLVHIGLGSQLKALRKAARNTFNKMKIKKKKAFDLFLLTTSSRIAPKKMIAGSISIVIIEKNQSRTINSYDCQSMIISTPRSQSGCRQK